MSRFDFFPFFLAHLHNTCSSRRPQFNDGKSKILSPPVPHAKATQQLDDSVRFVAIDSELEPSTAGCYGNSAVGDAFPRRHKGDGFFTHLYPLDSARLVFATMQMHKEPSKCNIVSSRHTTFR